MNILFTTENMLERAGSKTYAVAAAKAMKDMGHTVSFVTRDFPDGPMGQLALEVGKVMLYAGLSGQGEHYDVVFVSPNACDDPVLRKCCGKIVSISHGRIGEEMPVQGADGYAFVSEEIMDFWTENLDFATDNLHIVRNPINRLFWNCPDVGRDFQRIACISNYDDIPWLEQHLSSAGIDLIRVKHQHPEAVKFAIEISQLVIASGRSCYEAMACGREVLILDNRLYNEKLIGYSIACDGLVSSNYISARRSNCSGRTSTEEFTELDFGRTLSSALEWKAAGLRRVGSANRNYIKMHHDSHVVARQLLSI